MKKLFEFSTRTKFGLARMVPIGASNQAAGVSGGGAKKIGSLTIVTVLVAALTHGSMAAAQPQTAVTLGSAGSFAVLSGTAVTNTGPSVLNGNLGVYPGTSVTGFGAGEGVVNGTEDVGNVAAQTAQGALNTAYNDAAGRLSIAIVGLAGDISGQTLAPGLYKSTSTLSLSGTVTLHGRGVYIFQIASGLTVGNGGAVVLSGGATSDNVFWQVGSSASLGTTANFKGTILALTSVSLATGATLDGRALAQHAAVTLNANDVTVPSQSYVADTYNSSNKQLTIPSVAIGDAIYLNMVVNVGHVVSGPSGSGPNSAQDVYNPANGQITIPAVTVGSNTYFNVIATVTGLVSIGSVTFADSYNPVNRQLTISSVLFNSTVYNNVVINVDALIGVVGGMPAAVQDQFTLAYRRLFIPAVQVGGRVFTNVTVTAGSIVSVGGSQQ